jgi:dolichol kinase
MGYLLTFNIGSITFVDIVIDIVKAIPLFVYIIMLVYILTRKLYSFMVSRGLRDNVAIYYNRKIIHILSGGVVALLVPSLFKEPFVPMVFAYVLAFATYLPHRKRQLLKWFQTEDNMYEVNFCIAWGTTIAFLWILIDNPWISILPALAISFGDAVTGIVRNIIFGYRTKHWIGNIAMMILMIPIGYKIAGHIGAISMAIASIIERIEVNPIDDNLLISFSVAIILAIWYTILH